jgi:Ni,Fe-hydrogenase III large subunit
VVVELERTWSHLNDVAAMCAGCGFAAGNNHYAALTEEARRLNAALTGHRFLFGSVQVGGSALEIGAGATSTARERLASIRQAHERSWRVLRFNFSFQDRLPDIGIVSADDARRLGTVGPAARAAGLAEDARSGENRLSYDGFAPVVPARAAGDVRARLDQRALELEQSFDLLEQLLNRPLGPSAATNGEPERDLGVGRVESPRGATSCIVERDGDRVARLRLRTGSYANWPSVAFAAADNLLPDFPLINKSFELCYACADR